jgi:octaprenyl-diphosphate synthase
MVHMSTLVHDDVLDEADLRRRGQTVNRLQGNEAAVMLGDYLISHAYHLCCSLGARVAEAVAAATNTVCEGELLQLSHRGDWELSARTYFEIVRRKTAALTAACCGVPAMLVEASADRPADSPVGAATDPATALRTYGEKVGIAFQIIDDVLDLVGDEAVVGKSLGRDLAKGKLTLPLILWRDEVGEAGADADAAGLTPPTQPTPKVAMLGRAASGEAVVGLAEQVRRSGAVDAAYRRADVLVEDAKAALVAGFPDSSARRRLSTLAEATLIRQK